VIDTMCKRIPIIMALTVFCLSGVAAASETPQTERRLQPGPFQVGQATLPLVDYQRPTPANGACPSQATRTLTTEVWYPVADASYTGKLPLVIIAHGLTSNRTEGAYLATHLASHGYVVAAPDFPLSNGTTNNGSVCYPSAADVGGQVGDLFYLTAALTSPQLQAVAPFTALIDPARKALIGHSLGGTTVALAGSYASLYGVNFDAVITLAPGACPLFLPGQPGSSLAMPSLVIQGTTDAVTHYDTNAVPLFDSSKDPKYLVAIENGSHLGFVGSAAYFEATYPTVPLDTLICSALAPLLAGDPGSQACGVCSPPYVTTGLQIPSARQQALTKATVLAFLEGYLSCVSPDQAYLMNQLDNENNDVTVTYVGTAAKGQAHCANR
jgi:alpha-beta hydrolase superfamily lysophospholipase